MQEKIICRGSVLSLLLKALDIKTSQTEDSNLVNSSWALKKGIFSSLGFGHFCQLLGFF